MPGWREFARAAGDLCRRHGVALVGGDTTRGPLTITVTIMGIVPIGVALERRGAQAGDAVFVTGSPGDAAAGLALEQNRLHVADPMSAQILRDRFLFPTPRCEVGVALRGLASACIDVSDGLGGDLEKALRGQRLRRGNRRRGVAGVRCTGRRRGARAGARVCAHRRR